MSLLRQLGLFNREGMKACNDGKMANALFQLVQADRLAKEMGSVLHEAKVRNNMGLVHQVSGKTEEALACFELAAHRAVEGAGVGNSLHKAIVRNMTKLTSSNLAGAA
ncbi:tetratricopeptide repeat protein [Pseudodesulfovibrio sp. JC047]|uniref:tetratricopeptide repeat protein n=1 Tax=Pseudodesulfovibrio sp. JC047 TaxID=2683199 RepID=UPI0013D762BF|nr:tetratricopeptide repeat protein [Pseudodesulfovibrio sp. JC047]NDV20415.1 tetratricopeptide repeat protein [Pseudodesulfovibrio sp. JC047]